MWRNQPFHDFVDWLKQLNQQRRRDERPAVHLNGLDIYSMFESADEVITYLEQVDDNLAAEARARYETLGTFRPEAADYCRAIFQGKIASQAPQVASMLASLNAMSMELCGLEGDGDEFFNAVENARVVGAAEEYYRKSYMGGNVTWNIRDGAMVTMIERTIAFQERKWKAAGVVDRRPRVLVWAHNSHVGDALATEHHERRQWNVGRLVRAKFGYDNSFIVGFSTYAGTVRAARTWNGRDYVMELSESLPGSVGHLLHRVAKEFRTPQLAVVTRTNSRHGLSSEQRAARQVLNERRLERFVGVQYIKRTERQSHYSLCSVAEQFDAVVHLDKTSAVRPLPRPGTIDYRKFENFDESAGSQEDYI
jgi:erythromycin esterase-like protein